MIPKPSLPNHIYSFKYDYHNSDLCKLESRQLFGVEEKDHLLFSDIKHNPSISPFIKYRFDILSSSNTYSGVLETIRDKNIYAEGFKAEYLVLDGDTTEYPERLLKLRDIGNNIGGKPNYVSPSIIYSICYYNAIWYFGVLLRSNIEWQKHKKKPFSFSNSIGMNIGKTLVSIASKGDTSIRLLDACCGVGTVLLEACFSGINIEGCEIGWKACKHTRDNLAHYNYTANVYCSDIKNHKGTYDAAIIDLPYNLYSYSTDEATINIIESTAKLADRVVIVSISDIEKVIKNAGLTVLDFCSVEKRGKSTFTRKIWVCEKN